MYQFNYQNLLPATEPYFSCIVPAAWLNKKLPTMGGCVNYAADREQLDSCADTVLEFVDAASAEESVRTISLDILSSGQRLFDQPAKIHCRTLDNSQANDEWCIEVLLLNHFFGSNALSATMGNIYLDFADLQAVMQTSSDFDFIYGIGDSPSDILPGLLEREAKCAFGMIFCDNKKMRLAYLVETQEAIEAVCTEDAVYVLSDVAVEQDRMLISFLVGA